MKEKNKLPVILFILTFLAIPQYLMGKQSPLNKTTQGAPVAKTGYNCGDFWFVTNTGELLEAVEHVRQAGMNPHKVAEPAKKTSDYENFIASSKEFSNINAFGGTIMLAPGVYKIRNTIEFKNCKQITIKGSGWSTVLMKEGAGNAFLFEESTFCSVKDMKIIGDSTAEKGSGIAFRGQGSSCSVVNNCRIRHFAQSGIWFEATPSKPMSSTVVSNCHLIGNRTHQIYNLCNNDFIITGNQFGTHQSGQFDPTGPVPLSGTYLDHSSAGNYSQNFHWDNTVALRMSGGCHFNRFENNRFEESRENGILINTPDGKEANAYNIFNGNTIHSNSKFNSGKFSPVVAYHTFQTTFTNNQIFSWNTEHTKFKNCIEFDNGCGEWIVTGNIFKHSTGKALLYNEAGNHIVKDNLE